MIIRKERTRLLITEFTDEEYKKIENMVAAMDNVFMYYDKYKKLIGMETGMENSLKKIFKNAKFIDNSTEYWPYARIEPVEHSAKPRNQLQVDFINFVLENAKKKQKLAGILSPGVGKTFLACFCAISLKIKTLIIAPTSGIKEQWADTLTGMFKVPKERVLNIRSPKQFINTKADFVVISQASLASLNKNYDLEAILRDNKFGIKVIDEVQMWFKNIVQVDANCNIANNWYLTGTFGRSGATENKIYQEMFGDLAIFREKDKKPTLFNPRPGNVYGMKPHMNIKMMWTNAELTKAQLKKVTASMRYSEREGKWMRFGISVPAYSECVFPSDGRMTKYLKTCLKVIRMAEREVTYGRTLVLTSTISATFTFQKYLQEMYPNKKIGTYHSKNTKEENAKNKAECDILVSTISSAGTGFDMKDLSKLITCTMWASWILSDQISGRCRRRPDGKDTYMWDIVDSQIPQSRAWARARADVYRRKAKTFKVVDIDL